MISIDDATMKTPFRLCLTFVLVLLCPAPLQAFKIEKQPDLWLDIGLLVQPHIQAQWAQVPEDKFLLDFYLRRTRIILAGQLTPWLSFFADTDQPNWGKNGDWTTSEF